MVGVLGANRLGGGFVLDPSPYSWVYHFQGIHLIPFPPCTSCSIHSPPVVKISPWFWRRWMQDCTSKNVSLICNLGIGWPRWELDVYLCAIYLTNILVIQLSLLLLSPSSPWFYSLGVILCIDGEREKANYRVLVFQCIVSKVTCSLSTLYWLGARIYLINQPLMWVLVAVRILLIKFGLLSTWEYYQVRSTVMAVCVELMPTKSRKSYLNKIWLALAKLWRFCTTTLIVGGLMSSWMVPSRLRLEYPAPFSAFRYINIASFIPLVERGDPKQEGAEVIWWVHYTPQEMHVV